MTIALPRVSFLLAILVCPVRDRVKPKTDKRLFEKWYPEVHFEEVLTCTLAKEPVSSNEEFDLRYNPLLAFARGRKVRKKEVCHLELDVLVPPPTAPEPRQKVKGKKALPSPPPPPLMPLKKMKGRKNMPNAPSVHPPTFQKAYSKNHPGPNNPFWIGMLVDEQGYVMNQELSHMEINEPHMCTLAGAYIKGVSKWM